MYYKNILINVFFIIAITPLHSQNKNEKPRKKALAKMRYHEFFDKENHFDYKTFLDFRKEENKLLDGIDKRRFLEELSFLETYIGNYLKSIEAAEKSYLQPTDMMVFDSLGNMTKTMHYPIKKKFIFPDSILTQKYSYITYKKFIEKLHDSVKVVAINESHKTANYRKTLYNSLEVLKSKGFKYLALETLYQEKQKMFNTSTGPLKSSGYFTSETIMGDVIRKAKKLGYQLISYDQQVANSQLDRENKSFKNLMNRTFKIDPEAKVILFAGHSHISEVKTGGIKNLGLQFKENGIDPFTINQLGFHEAYANPKIYRTYILLPKNNTINKRYDARVLTPKSTIVFGRPSWIWEMDRDPIKIKREITDSIKLPIIIEAYYANESFDNTPLDRVEVSNSKYIPHLALRKGKFKIRVIDSKNKHTYYELIVD